MYASRNDAKAQSIAKKTGLGFVCPAYFFLLCVPPLRLSAFARNKFFASKFTHNQFNGKQK
jgi:hypothetical protein